MEYAMGLEEAFLFCQLQPCPPEGDTELCVGSPLRQGGGRTGDWTLMSFLALGYLSTSSTGRFTPSF